MPSSTSPRRATVRASVAVIDPGDLRARVDALLAGVDMASVDVTPTDRRTNPHPYVEAGRRAEMLHRLWGTVAPAAIPAPAGIRGRATRVIKRLVRRSTSWYVEPRWSAQHELDAETARFATDSVLAARRTYLELRDARYEIDALRRELHEQHSATAVGLREIASANQQIGELRAALDGQRERIDQIASHATSTTDVSTLREQVAGLMARLGVASAYGGTFDYVAFEDRFRGDSTALAALQADYVTKFPPSNETGAIVDVGCGRGEMLELLREAGHEVVGIDLDQNMVEVCRSKGLPVLHGDGTSWLELCPKGSLKGVFCAQVIEHLLTPEIERFLRASLVALRPGGVLVMETINPRSLHALGNHFFADVSHVRPVHPETLRFMCEQTGFADVALIELSPHPAVAAAEQLGHDPVDDAVRQLVSSVFGFQDYAIVATKGS